jgi:hypothetical protein
MNLLNIYHKMPLNKTFQVIIKFTFSIQRTFAMSCTDNEESGHYAVQEQITENVTKMLHYMNIS